MTTHFDIPIEDMATEELERMCAGESPVEVLSETRRPYIGQARVPVTYTDWVWSCVSYGEGERGVQKKFFGTREAALQWLEAKRDGYDRANPDLKWVELRNDESMVWWRAGEERRKPKRKPYRAEVWVCRYTVA